MFGKKIFVILSTYCVIKVYIMSYLLKLQLWSETYITCPSGPNVVSGPQTPRSRNFLRFHDFIGFIS